MSSNQPRDPLIHGPVRSSATDVSAEKSANDKVEGVRNPLRDLWALLFLSSFFKGLAGIELNSLVWVKAIFFAILALAVQQHMSNINSLSMIEQFFHQSMEGMAGQGRGGLFAPEEWHELGRWTQKIWIWSAQANVIWAPVRELAVLFFQLSGIFIVLKLFGVGLNQAQLLKTLLGLIYLRWYGFWLLLPTLGSTLSWVYNMFGTLFLVRWMWGTSRGLSILAVSIWAWLGLLLGLLILVMLLLGVSFVVSA